MHNNFTFWILNKNFCNSQIVFINTYFIYKEKYLVFYYIEVKIKAEYKYQQTN